MDKQQIKAGSLIFGNTHYVAKTEYTKLAERLRDAEFKLRKKTMQTANRLATAAVNNVFEVAELGLYHSDDPRQLSLDFDA